MNILSTKFLIVHKTVFQNSSEKSLILAGC